MSMSQGEKRKFVLAHADALYSNGILESFLSGLGSLLAVNVIRGDEIEIRFVNGEPDRRLVHQVGLDDHVVYTRVSSKLASVQSFLAKSDAVLFIQRGACNGYIPEKFFQLLTLKTRILAIVPNPVAYEDYCSSDGGVYVVEGRNQAGVADAFLRMYRDWKRNPVPAAAHSAARCVWTEEKIDSGGRIIQLSRRSAA